MSQDGIENETPASETTEEISANGDAGAEGEGPGEGDASAGSSLPSDVTGWRTLVAALPARDLFRMVQKDRILSAHLFAGFRPSADMLRHPVVLGRLVEDAQRHRPLAEALAALTPPAPTEATTETTAEPERSQPAASPVSNKVAPVEDLGLKEVIKRQKNSLREKDARIQELTAQAQTLQRERDAARAETETLRQSLRGAKEEAERERRLREREARREKNQPTPTAAKENANKVAAPTAQPTVLPTRPQTPLPFTEAINRLLNRGRYAIVVEVCREALATDAATESSAGRGRVHALLAGALYGLGEVNGGEDQDRLAANALLDGGEIVASAEALARLFAQTAYYAPGSPVRQADAATLRRLLLLAERDGLALAVQEVFTRMRIGSAEAGRRLRATLALGGRKSESLANAAFGAPTEGDIMLGPDEAVSLLIGGVSTATVTARELALAVDAGDAGFVAQVRKGLASLKERGGKEARLADALLEAVTTVEPVAVIPLLAKKSDPVLVDASNVARYNPDPLALTPTPHVTQLLMVRDYLLRQGFFPVILVADANLRFHVDDRTLYHTLLERQIVRETPPGTSADEALLSEARARRALLVSNDRFTEWGELAARVERQGFLIAGGRVALVS